ncbi:MAG: hypothetical protein Q9180_005484 [Flavoplaca navasiana]
MYTRGELTFPSDKLIVIPGVAKFIRNMWQSHSVRYLAGLWSYRLEWSLAWSALDGTPLVSDEYRAPTWSWASVNGPVRPAFDWHEDNGLLTQILQAYTKPVSNSFGAVKAGFIRLSGSLCHVDLQDKDEEPCSEQFPLLLTSTGHRIRFEELYFDNRGTRGDQSTVTEQEYALAGLSVMAGTQMFELVLQTTGRKLGQYSRIGYCHIRNDGPPYQDDEDIFECQQCQYEENASNVPWFLRSNDYKRMKEALRKMDLPPSMYEQQDNTTSTYIYEMV